MALYAADMGAAPFPIVVMAHGFSALKEMGLDQYAEVFARAGLAALVYDNRNLGASEGNPRFEIDPTAQMRDYRHAITYAQISTRKLSRSHRRLGHQLYRRSCIDGSGLGQTSEMRSEPSSIHQRL